MNNQGQPSGAGTVNRISRLQSEQGKRIISIAIKGFLKHGYNGCSIEYISSAAGMTKGSLYHYIDSKKCLVFACMDFIVERFNEISFGDEKRDLYGLHDGEIVALLPMVLLESDMDELKQDVIAYYKMWANLFFTCGNRLDDTLKNFDKTSNHYTFWTWLGFWMVAHIGVLPISDFNGMRALMKRGGRGDV